MAQVLNQFGDAYDAQYPWQPEHVKVVNSIRACRTETLGGYRLHCEQCGKDMTYYCSCRNRHCPHCQKQASEQWRLKQQQGLLPVAYFHLVFTLPHSLNGWVKLHPDVLYGLLFQAVWSVLKRFGEDPKRLDGQLGMTAVLHTWGQQLDQHVHLHCLVPAGAWSQEAAEWHPAKSTYLFPTKALARCFRGKMVSLIRLAWQQNTLSHLTNEKEIRNTLNALMKTDWVVYTKACHGDPERVVDYLSRYTHRIALSESRILGYDESNVHFRWKDYRDDQKKVMSLSGVEFIRRFLQHVLPKGFMRIRHYGFLSNRWRKQRVNEIRQNLRCTPLDEVIDQAESADQLQTPYFCSCCQSRDVKVVEWIMPIKLRRC